MISMKIVRSLAGAAMSVLLMLTGCTPKSKPSDPASEPERSEQTKPIVMDAADANLTLYERNVMPDTDYQSLTIVMDSVLADAGEERVPVRVMVFRNPGYVNYGIRLLYTEALQPLCKENTDEPYIEAGNACEDMMMAARVDASKQMIGFVAAGAEENGADGILYTLYFDIPSDAKSGTVYPLSLDVQDFKNSDGEQLMPTVVQGGIQIR